MLLDIHRQKYPILISLHKSGSTWVNSFIHKRYRRIGLTPPPRNLYTEFFCNNRGENREHIFVRKTNEERIALLEHLRTFGLELNQKAHIPEIVPVWPWFKEFYKDHDILVLKRRHIWSHYLNILFFNCVKEVAGNVPTKVTNALDEDILKEANLEDSETVLALTNDDENNMMACVLAEKTGLKKRTIAIVNKTNYNLLQDSLNICLLYTSPSPRDRG